MCCAHVNGLLSDCSGGTQTREQYACEDSEMYVSCGQSMIHVVDANYGRLDNSMCVCCGQSTIHVVDANYGRLDNSMCADQLGTPNDNCHHNATCFAKKWSPFLQN